MKIRELVYLFDPLCGWCYGASPKISQLVKDSDFNVTFRPTGLFAREGARDMTPEFAQYAWQNDMRIESSTGQVFSEAYRDNVLHQGGVFDSFASTLAVIAANTLEPERAGDVLKTLQKARYVDGLDNTSSKSVVEILEREGFESEALAVARPTEELLRHYEHSLRDTQTLLDRHNINGVPALIVVGEQGQRLIPAAKLFAPYAELKTELLRYEGF